MSEQTPNETAGSTTRTALQLISGSMVGAGLLLNEFAVASLFSADGVILPWNTWMIRVFNVSALAGGLLVYRRARDPLPFNKANAALCSVSLVMAVIVAEIIAGLAVANVDTAAEYAYPSNVRQLRIFAPPTSALPFDVKPGFEQEFNRSEFETTVRTNNVGFREESDYVGGAIDIGVIGDSFIFGYGVNVGDRVSDILQRNYPDLEVLSFAYASGYAPHHYLLFFKENPDLMPRTLVLALFPHNDLASDAREAEFVLDASGSLVAVHQELRVDESGMLVKGDPATSVIGLLERFNLGRLLLVARGLVNGTHDGAKRETPSPVDAGELDDYALTELGFLEQLSVLAEERGTRFVVMLVPASWLVGDYLATSPYKDDVTRDLRATGDLLGALQQWFSESGIEFLNPTAKFKKLEAAGERLYYERDGHWTVRGHRAAAEVLFEYLETSR